MIDEHLGPLGRHAARLEHIDPSELTQLDPWFEAALTSTSTAATGSSLAVAKLGLLRRVLLGLVLATPPVAGVVTLDHHSPPTVTVDDALMLEPGETVVAPLAWHIPRQQTSERPAPAPSPVSVADPQPRPTAPRSAPAMPQPSLPSAAPIIDTMPTPEELAMIDRARSLVQQVGSEAAGEAEYIAIIKQSRNQYVVEVAYRELITKLVTDGRFDDARRHAAAYKLRFVDGRYNRRFQIMINGDRW